MKNLHRDKVRKSDTQLVLDDLDVQFEVVRSLVKPMHS